MPHGALAASSCRFVRTVRTLRRDPIRTSDGLLPRFTATCGGSKRDHEAERPRHGEYWPAPRENTVTRPVAEGLSNDPIALRLVVLTAHHQEPRARCPAATRCGRHEHQVGTMTLDPHETAMGMVGSESEFTAKIVARRARCSAKPPRQGA
jgi:hypothetical protein